MSQAITPDVLHRRALYYLERYAASVDGVRQVLQRSLLRAQRKGIEVPDHAGEWIESTIEKLVAQGFLNDASFAEVKTRALRRAGASSLKVRQKLLQKGVTERVIDEALTSPDTDAGDDRHAILIYARKKRLGVYASAQDRANKREKHMAALLRAGFSSKLVRPVLDAASIHELEQQFTDDEEF